MNYFKDIIYLLKYAKKQLLRLLQIYNLFYKQLQQFFLYQYVKQFLQNYLQLQAFLRYKSQDTFDKSFIQYEFCSYFSNQVLIKFLFYFLLSYLIRKINLLIHINYFIIPYQINLNDFQLGNHSLIKLHHFYYINLMILNLKIIH